ncbi:MAG: hypothetical protein HY805_02235 [Nitrospirae bacterium]|nr:hypothetical protein [Nitrospirota bacterium]
MSKKILCKVIASAILMDKARLIEGDEKGGNLNKMKKIEHSNDKNEDNSST